MPNKNYLKGRRKEYKIMRELDLNGCDIVLRSAGSHSAIDVIGINKDEKIILCVQCKPDTMPEMKKAELLKEVEWLNDNFEVRFLVR